MCPKWEHFRWKKPTNTPKPPSDTAIVNKRLIAVQKMIIQWYRSFQIITFGVTERGLSEMQMSRYIKKANELISVVEYSDVDREKKKAVLVYDEVLQNGFANQNMPIVLSAQQQKNRVLWLEAPKKLDLSGNINVNDIIQKWAASVREKFLNKAKGADSWRW